MAKSSLKTTVVAGILLIAMPHHAHAAWPVTDATAIAKATEQLNAMKEQLDKLNEMKEQVDEQIKAIGKYGKIALPIINAAKMGNQLKKDMQCLMPDWKELIPELKLEEQMFSICDRSQFYRDNLWVDPVKVGGEPVVDGSGWSDPNAPKKTDWQAINKARNKVKNFRQGIIFDATSKGLAQGDQANETVEQTAGAIEDLQAALDSATDQNSRLAAIGQGQVVVATAQNQTNQLLAQLLKVMSAFVMEAGIPLERYGVQNAANQEGTN
jgi:DNA repair exonuclease SbcCD ATPase subunit